VTYFTDEDAPFLKTCVHLTAISFSKASGRGVLTPSYCLRFFRIANVILQSGSAVPDWILKLPKPSKMKRREMGKVKRPDAVNTARKVGRADAIKRRCVLRISSGCEWLCDSRGRNRGSTAIRSFC
jgi:ATP-dependent RNA helicase DDX52/ROK1